MRLLLVNRALPIHVAGGLERHFEDLALGIAQAGHEVHLLTAALPAGRAAEERERLAGQGLTLHALDGVDAARYSLKWMRHAPERIAGLCREHAFDLVHAQEFAAGFWKSDAGLPPLVVTVHGTLTSETPLHHDVWPYLPWSERPGALLRYGRRILFARAWKKMLHSARRVLVDSQFTRGELVRLYPGLADRVRVVPLGVPWAEQPVDDHDAAREALGWNGTTTQLLTLGRIEWAKGQDLAIEALAGLKEFDWHYTIAGEGSWRPRVEKLIDQHGLRERVTLLGRVEVPQIRRLLAGADLFLWPERTHPAFGLVGMEAHLAGTPVLANRRGAIAEVVGDDAKWLVEEPVAEYWRIKLREILNDAALLKSAREGLARRALERFSYARMIETTVSVFEEIV